ncbi:MAG TPA: hypothetical protein PKD72_11515, partial [Gemmatales bacterium]|nr:hypothetical protein [Gemmatales bacterium]
ANSGAKAKTVEAENAKAVPSHEVVREVTVKPKHKGNTLQTISADAKGNILCIVGPGRYISDPSTSKNITEVQIYDRDGKLLSTFDLDFTGQAICGSSDGKIYVAGDAHIACFDEHGKLEKKVELPHISKLIKNTEQLKKDAEAQLKMEKGSFEQSVKQISDMKQKIEDKKVEDRTAREKQMLKQYEAILESYKQTEEYYSKRTVDSVLHETLTRLRYINAVAVNQHDVYIVCGESKGYGFAIWRMNSNFEEPVLVKGNISGCCGQMDLCCDGENLLVAENTLKKFARYSRDGKQLGKWGKAGDQDVEGFGGCCNPANVRVSNKGDIYTSESEGIIKRFNHKGEFQGLVFKVPVTGGCKNAPIAMSPDEERLYFGDQIGNKIVILGKKKVVVSR